MGNSPPSGSTHTITVPDPSVANADRSVRIYVPAALATPDLAPPPSLPPPSPVPVVVSLHGGGGNAKGWQETQRLDHAADKHSFIAVYPSGFRARSLLDKVVGERLLVWNAAPGKCGPPDGADDVAWLVAVVAAVVELLPGLADRRRVWATGLSNGGYMCYRLLTDAPHVFAAFVAVGGILAPYETPAGADALASPRPFLHIHSLDDPRALYAGGRGPPFPGTKKTIEQTPVDDAVAAWRSAFRVADVEPHETTVAADDDSGHVATQQLWQGSSPSAVYGLMRITGGVGHVWPGAVDRPLLRKFCGAQTAVIDASEVLWNFCSAAPPLDPC